MPSVTQVSLPMALSPAIMAETLGRSRSFTSRQAAPMQKRCAPPALALAASASTRWTSISLEAGTPVSKLADWLQ